MNLRFNVNPETGLPHIYDHSVQEYGVQDVLDDPGDVKRDRRGLRIAIGQTRGGRYLQVIYRLEQATDVAFIITAYDPNNSTLDAFRCRRRRRGR